MQEPYGESLASHAGPEPCAGHGNVAGDFVTGFQHRREAEWFLKELRERLEKFGLALHSDKTRLIARRSGTPVWCVPHLEFGRSAASNRKRRGEGKPDTFQVRHEPSEGT